MIPPRVASTVTHTATLISHNHNHPSPSSTSSTSSASPASHREQGSTTFYTFSRTRLSRLGYCSCQGCRCLCQGGGYPAGSMQLPSTACFPKVCFGLASIRPAGGVGIPLTCEPKSYSGGCGLSCFVVHTVVCLAQATNRRFRPGATVKRWDKSCERRRLRIDFVRFFILLLRIQQFWYRIVVAAIGATTSHHSCCMRGCLSVPACLLADTVPAATSSVRCYTEWSHAATRCNSAYYTTKILY